MRKRALAAIGVLALVTAACGAAGSGVTAVESGNDSGGLFTDDTTDGTGTPTTEPDYPIIDGVVDFGDGGPQHPEYDGFLTAAFGDIEEYWKQTFPEVYGSEFQPLSGGIYSAYPSRTTPIPGCGTPESTYEDVRQGTAFYCIEGDFMAYDDAEGLPGLVDELGKEAVAVVLAHEFGHAIQARANEWNNIGVLKEQQADCFAGAWTAHVASGGSDLIRFDDNDVRAGLVAMLEVRDPIQDTNGQSPLLDDSAHGTGFDRVGAFQDGFIGGAQRCKSFFTENREQKLIDIPFDATDVNAGNLPLIDPNPDPTNGPSDIITLIPGSLDFYWNQLLQENGIAFTSPTFQAFPTAGPYPTCDGVADDQWQNKVTFCAADNTIYWDQDYAQSLASDPLTGDMSVGYLFADAYSDAVQTAARWNHTGEPRSLVDDCLTGTWVKFIVPPVPTDRENQLVLSAGDLDEAVITAIAVGDPHADTNVNGSAFEKIDAFRTGVLNPVDVCNTTYGG